MKIRIVVEPVTEAQWRWLLENVRQEWEFLPDDVQVCVEFAHENGLQHRHVEMEVDEFTLAVKDLKRFNVIPETERFDLTKTGRQVVTGTEDPGLKLGRIGTNSGHGHVWKRPDSKRTQCGGPAMCNKCAEDLKLVNGLKP